MAGITKTALVLIFQAGLFTCGKYKYTSILPLHWGCLYSSVIFRTKSNSLCVHWYVYFLHCTVAVVLEPVPLFFRLLIGPHVFTLGDFVAPPCLVCAWHTCFHVGVIILKYCQRVHGYYFIFYYIRGWKKCRLFLKIATNTWTSI